MQTEVFHNYFSVMQDLRYVYYFFFSFKQLSGTFLCVNFASKLSSLPYTSLVQCNFVQSRRVQCIVVQCCLICSWLDQTQLCTLSGMVKQLEFAHFALIMGCYLMYCMLLQCTERGYFKVQCSVVQWCQSDPYIFLVLQ